MRAARTTSYGPVDLLRVEEVDVAGRVRWPRRRS